MAKAVRAGDLATVKALLMEGFPPDQPYLFGTTQLMIAAQRGHLDIAGALIDARANVNARGTSTALCDASFAGHLAIIQLLIDRGADIHLTDELSRTPLMQAALGGQPEAVTLLLERGADVRPVDEDHETALFKAARAGSAACIRKLLEAGGNPTLGARTGETPLSMVAGPFLANHPEAAYELIAAGASLEPYEVSAEHGPPTTNGYALNHRDKQGWTILMFAATHGNAGVARRLLAHGVDRGMRNADGMTAAQVARSAGHADLAALLDPA